MDNGLPPQPPRFTWDIPKTEATEQVAQKYLIDRGLDPNIIKTYTTHGSYRFNGKSVPAVGFPYRGDAVKWRSADSSKQFSQTNVCEDFFLLDTYVEGNEILICEGEIDALAWLTVGLGENVSVFSIPNGAPAKVTNGKVDPKDDNKFRYIWRAKKQLESAPRIYLNPDNDTAGKALAEEVMRRVGRAKTWNVSLGDFKDAGEALKEKGPEYLREAFNAASPAPMIGLHTGVDFDNQFLDLYDYGRPKGIPTGIAALDDLMKVAPGMLTIVTGMPGTGKSDLVDQICLNMADTFGWNTVYCSFEKPAEMHIVQLAEKLVGKPFFDGPTPRMTPEERDYAMAWVNKHFMFMDYRRGGPSDIDGILDTASAAVMRLGCRNLVIDPYNYISIDRSDKLETDAINDMLTRVQQWSKEHECHVFFVAHPAKPGSDRRTPDVVVTGLDVAKSMAWFSKADIGLTVTRPPDGNGDSWAHIWKIRWSWMGRMGKTPLSYDPICSRWSSPSGIQDDFDWHF